MTFDQSVYLINGVAQEINVGSGRGGSGKIDDKDEYEIDAKERYDVDKVEFGSLW